MIRKGNYAFIDSQNLNLGTQKTGWKMDWRRFRQFLQNQYGVTKAYMFIGHMPEYEDLYVQMHDAGYLVVLKPTLETMKSISKKEEKPAHTEENGEQTPSRPTKGNVDADLVLWAMKEMRNYKKAIVVSGDGDFFSLYEYLAEQGKLMHIFVPNWQYSQLLQQFDNYLVRLDRLRSQLAYHDRRSSGRRDQKPHS